MQQIVVDEAALQGLKEIMGEDFCQLVDTFLNDSVTRLEKLKHAVEAQDAEQIRALAHGFKGSALNLSAMQLTELCRQLEAMGRDNQLSNAKEVYLALEKAFEKVQQYFQ